MAVRRSLPWPLRWLLGAALVGLSAAVALWAFDLGRSLAGLEAGSREQLQQLRIQGRMQQEENRQQSDLVAQLRAQLDAASSLRVAERAATDHLTERLRQLEADNRSLRDDLAFFEKLIPASGTGKPLDIRGLQAEVLGDGSQLRWQVLVIQPVRNAPEFKGQLELVLAGSLQGKPWSSQPPAVVRPLQFQQYRRVEGLIDLPEQAVIKTVTVRLLEGSSTRAMQSLNMG